LSIFELRVKITTSIVLSFRPAERNLNNIGSGKDFSLPVEMTDGGN